MKDKYSETKARHDWATVQDVADRRFPFPEPKKSFLGFQARRITDILDELQRLEDHDDMIYSDHPTDGAGWGKWPFK